MSKTVIVVPTYNEKENLPKLAADLLALPVSNIEMLVVDDNSPDGTGKVADDLSANDARIHVLHRAGKQGLGTAYIQGFRKAMSDYGADVVIQMDADFSHDPKYVPGMLDALSNPDVDVVVGSRYVKGGSLDERWSFFRRLLSWWANVVWVGFILRTPIKDNTAGFRAWKRATLQGMDLSRVRSNGYVFQVEMTYIALRLGYKFREVPIHFADRRYGTSKMGVRVAGEAAIRVFQVLWRHRALNPSQRAVITATGD
jgi:dolichol-phosphate mannosyltransferase